ncbi:hypothetical protein ACFFSH_38460 [Streptomyces filamentosus]|uniref:Uncharacterized protein n=1 Tax=Streptomyces filamentosus TaxID=67294 RepID=A0A919BB34_STRFL|nr:hypothetical protein [Streptomyces filamentosus]GHF77111.1 hypothetical protein GCM10017667_00500 [Streptomyces filamentosus]
MAIPGNALSDLVSTIEPNSSGWASLLNCTLSRATGGTASDGCLQMRSVASGEMRCRTTAGYDVLPGVEYLAFADASGATVPERIGIRWLTAAFAEISVSWSLTTAAASATWHRIAVADYAPAGAAFAHVVFSSTPAAAAVNSLFDNVYFGPPMRSTGNLLSANTETSERAAGWEYTATTNCTVARTVPAVNWSATAYTVGGHVATMTVTANGAAEFRSTDQPTVVPGQEYLAYAHLNPPASGTAAWIELRFYDAGLAQIKATRAVLAAPGTGWYRQRVSDFAPTNAAYASVAFGLSTATAGQVLRVDNVAVIVAPRFAAGSIVPYADADFEAGVGSWAVISGVAAISRSTPWGSVFRSGSYALTATSATATASVIRSGQYALNATGPHRITLDFMVSAGGWTLAVTTRYYNSSGTEILVGSSPPIAAPGAGWWELIADAEPPAAAAKIAIDLTLTATAVSSTIRLDRVACFPSLSFFEVTPQEATASVSIVIRELEVGNLLTLTRTTPDGVRTLVRGPDGLIDRMPITDSQFLIEDYEAPLGVRVVYAYETFEVGDTVADRNGAGGATIPAGDPNLAWLSDPGMPQRNLQVMVKTPPDWQRPIAQGEYRVRGRRNSVVLSDVRGGLEGDLVIWTRSDEERRALHWLLDSGRVVMWRAVPGMGIDDMYVAVGQVTEGRVVPQGWEVWREWTLPLRQVDMPTALGVSGSAGRTWQDVLTEYGTWADVLNRFATWEDVYLNRPKG